MWKNALIALATVTLLTTGLAIIIYVAVARDRIAPTPTARPVHTVSPIPSLTPFPTIETPSPQPTVVGKVREYTPGALIIVLEPTEGKVEQVIVPENLTITWADGKRASPRDIVPGQTIFAQGALDALGRMIAERIKIVTLAAATAMPTLPAATAVILPTVTLLPTRPANAWQGEYYPNRTLAGQPALIRADAEVNFSWGAGSPAPGLPVDNFSVRWTRSLAFEQGPYRFYARVDDGVRLWVDGVLVIDAWSESALATHVGYLWLSGGQHELRVEYFEAGGEAAVQVGWEKVTHFEGWQGEYFPNADLAGHPAFVRDDPEINFNWQLGTPGPAMPADNFSVRWNRTVWLEGGRYLFWAQADDGVRLYVDATLLINQWHDGALKRYEGIMRLPAGQHVVVVEYYERTGTAAIQAGWETANTPTPTLTPSATATPVTPSATNVPPTKTKAPTFTATPLPPTAVPTFTATSLPPTATATKASEAPTPTCTCEVVAPTPILSTTAVMAASVTFTPPAVASATSAPGGVPVPSPTPSPGGAYPR